MTTKESQMDEKDFPRLTYGRKLWIIAKAPGQVMVGGLGAMGSGAMWFKEDERHKEYDGYNEAPMRDGKGEMGWREKDPTP